MTSFQDSKPRVKQISPTFSYFLINNARLYDFLANWLAHNKKMTEKSVFREAWSPEMKSRSFPVSCFWSRGFVLFWRFWYIKTGEGKYLSKIFFAIYISSWRRFNRANKWLHDRERLHGRETERFKTLAKSDLPFISHCWSCGNHWSRHKMRSFWYFSVGKNWLSLQNWGEFVHLRAKAFP